MFAAFGWNVEGIFEYVLDPSKKSKNDKTRKNKIKKSEKNKKKCNCLFANRF